MTELQAQNERRTTVEKASRFLARLLRHEPEEHNLTLNGRGWASVKDVWKVFRREFDEAAGPLLKKVLESDDENRFQLSAEGTFGFVRATRGHTTDIELLPVLPESVQMFRVRRQERL